MNDKQDNKMTIHLDEDRTQKLQHILKMINRHGHIDFLTTEDKHYIVVQVREIFQDINGGK